MTTTSVENKPALTNKKVSIVADQFDDITPLTGKRNVMEEFIAYAEIERGRRRDAIPEFNDALYDDAVQLVLAQLRGNSAFEESEQ